MRLNLQTDYALRMLMHLAVNQDRLCTIADIAERYGISKNHLMKVAHLLGRDGFIETVRGRAGGLRLARPASEINVGDIVRRMEADFAVVECFAGGAGECAITPACRLKSVLKEALEAFLTALDAYTLDDLVRRNPRLRDLLAEEAA
ncbi:Rrf2 family transcriptional regulator [Hyphococcus luteus]|uniref:BadM/Rrf2 family transcriptional regulator n=1 Tax=Hyphococcus luteus TaxID=2058213 RepID=A0A2S7K2V6_9PROT|nr:Rrf2 family transcriptional regulator [Marinicaulis flavus]PQA86825.1 BadM/Rrf2 family transcriptional regulator [Marinicaulis flavus]